MTKKGGGNTLGNIVENTGKILSSFMTIGNTQPTNSTKKKRKKNKNRNRIRNKDNKLRTFGNNEKWQKNPDELRKMGYSEPFISQIMETPMKAGGRKTRKMLGGSGRGTGRGRGRGRGSSSKSSKNKSTKPMTFMDADVTGELKNRIRRLTNESKSLGLESKNPKDWEMSRSKAAEARYWKKYGSMEIQKDYGRGTGRAGTMYYNPMDFGEATADDILTDQMIVDSVKSDVQKILRTTHSAPIVKDGGIVVSNLETPYPGVNASKEDKEAYAFKRWWMKKEPHEVYFGKDYIRTDEGHGPLDTTIKGFTGQVEYKTLEINDDVFHVPTYINRKGFDEAFEKFKKLSDSNERKKEIIKFADDEQKKKSNLPPPPRPMVATSSRSIPPPPPVFRDIEREAEKMSSDMLQKRLDKIEEIRKKEKEEKESKKRAASSSSSAPKPKAPKKTYNWNDIKDNKNMAMRLTTKGNVMAFPDNISDLDEIQKQTFIVEGVPKTFVENMQKKQEKITNGNRKWFVDEKRKGIYINK